YPSRGNAGEPDPGPQGADCRLVCLGRGEPAARHRQDAPPPHELLPAAPVDAAGLQLSNGVEAHGGGQAGRFDHAGQCARSAVAAAEACGQPNGYRCSSSSSCSKPSFITDSIPEATMPSRASIEG